MRPLKSREELAMDFLDFYDDEEFNQFCHEIARILLGEEDLLKRSNKIAVVDEVIHTIDSLGPRSALDLYKEGDW